MLYLPQDTDSQGLCPRWTSPRTYGHVKYLGGAIAPSVVPLPSQPLDDGPRLL